RNGGVVLLQDRRDALSPSMPESAIRHVDIDHVLPVIEIPRLLLQLVRSSPKGGKDMNGRQRRKLDPAMAADLSHTVDGPPSSFICPECGGALWELKDGQLLHYRCHVGHAYTADGLMAGQDGAVEEALWTALRTLEEAAGLRRRLAHEARGH